MKYLNLLKSEKHLCGELQELQKGASYSFCSDPHRQISENRIWTAGNPYICSCGRATGWTTNGTPLCPACVPLSEREVYRKEMLDWANELEQVALTANDLEIRAARMSVVIAIRAEYS